MMQKFKKKPDIFAATYEPVESAGRGAMRPALRASPEDNDDLMERVAEILSDPMLHQRADYVQSFLYGADYVVRDVFLPYGEQELHRTLDADLSERRHAIERAKIYVRALLARGFVLEKAP